MSTNAVRSTGTIAPLDWRSRVRHWTPRLPWVGPLPLADAALAVFFLICAAVSVTFMVDYGVSFTYAANTALAVIIAGASAVRRKAVVSSFAVTYLALGALAALVWATPVNLGLNPIVIAAPVSLWAVTRWAPSRWWGVVGLLAGMPGGLVNPAVLTYGLGAESMLVFGLPAVLIIAGSYAFAAKQRTTAEQHAADLAAAMALSKLEVSRELHDVVGHGLTAIKVQAQTALYLSEAAGMSVADAPREPTPEEQALTAILATADDSLRDVHALVDSLRSGADIHANPADIPALVSAALPESMQATRHISVTLPEDFSAAAAWPLARRLALVRAATELATNMAKHAAGPGSFSMRLSEERARIATVNGVSRAASRSGTEDVGKRTGAGLAGLGERLAELGGHLTYTQVDGEFRVEVEL